MTAGAPWGRTVAESRKIPAELPRKTKYAFCRRVMAPTVRPLGAPRIWQSAPVDDLETVLLGEPPALTREEVEARASVSPERASAIWAAMGFAEVPYGQPAFTEADVKALETAASLVELGVIDADTLLVLARAMGQGLAKLAEAQLDAFRSLSAGMTVDEALSAAVGAAEDVLPRLEELVLFVWRRQFAAAVQRSIATARQDGMPVFAIGFLDLVNFTRSSRTWDARQLERTLERFERDTSLRVAAVGGRVVKTLGDGVLYTTDDASTAVSVALDTVAAHEVDGELPSVRAGVAVGPVLVRLGDVFGEPVNIASRLSDAARPGSVLVDKHAAEALEGFDLRPLHRRSVRGYRSLTPYLVRRVD
ncbi:MAG: adenylate cyclase [Frankiales bacterium]|nr:adenylate cyclase [Frankiales bacterium]